jgi:hypothetical protein
MIFVESMAHEVAYLARRVEERTKKQFEEFSCDEGGLSNTFITRSLQQNEYSVFPSKAKVRGASNGSPSHGNADAPGHHRWGDPGAKASFWNRKSQRSLDGPSEVHVA